MHRLCLMIALVVAGCAAPTPRVPYGPLAPGLDAFLDAHPLAPAAELRADEVGRTEGASYHLVQVRGAERPHRHATHDLTVLVLRGHGTLTLGVERIALRAGDAAVIPRDAPHWFANGGRDPAVALAVFTPPLVAPDSVPVTGVDSCETGR